MAKISVVAATGGTGRQVLEQAVAQGHDVTAVVRDPGRLAVAVPAVRADLTVADPAALASAFAGAGAVLSCLGPRSRTDAGIAAQGTRVVVEAMREAGVRRLVVISAAPVGTVPSPARPHPPTRDPGDGFVMRTVLNPVIKAVFRQNYADHAQMEDLVRDSGLDWTIVRPPRLTDGRLTGTYRTAHDRNLRRGMSVSRADLAHLMLRTLDRPETINKIIRIAS